jgi:signal transduction histidine kinase
MNKQNSFHIARLRLTAWYLLIIMLVSITFSIAFYLASSYGIVHLVAGRYLLSTGGDPSHFMLPVSIRNGLEDFKTGLRFALVIINGFIFVSAWGAGYFLAGRTLRPIKEMLEEQNRFITDASHELKTPLTALRSEFEVALLDEKKLQLKEAKQLIKSGLEEIVSLQGLAESLLALTQQQKRTGELKIESVSLLEVVEAALKKVIPLAKQKHIIIHNTVDDYLLAGEMQGLTELFVILLDNAIKYSSEASEVAITSKKIDHHIQIAVIDKGIGIGEKDLPHIFDRFYRADTSRSQIPGYGLGLSIAKQIVELHKGTITALHTPERGTTFLVRLPLPPGKERF